MKDSFFNAGTDKTATFTTGLILVLSVTICYILSSVLFIAGIGISAAVLPSAFLISCIAAAYGNSLRNTVTGVISASAVWIICSYLCIVLYDTSYDGNMYHTEIVTDLFYGWNPYLDPSGITSIKLWTEHYTKAMETVGACLMSVTDRIQSAKAVMIVLACGVFLMLPELLRRLNPRLSSRQSFLISLLTISNPVVLCQILRFYIDNVVYLTTVIAVVSGMLIAKGDRNRFFNYSLMAVAIVLAAGTKANALVYVVFTIICTMGWMFLYGDKKRILHFAGFCLIAGVVSVFGICWHPYVTNWISDGHPLYPLMGENPVDIMTHNTPEQFKGNNRIENFFRSVFSIKNPSVDQRSGGFTPFFILLFPISVLSIVYCSRKQRQFPVAAYTAVCVLASCFFFEQSWWARYIPQLWLLVPLSAYMLMLSGKSRIAETGRKAIVSLGVSAGCLCLSISVVNAIWFTRQTDFMYDVLEGSTVPMMNGFPQIRRMFMEKNIPVRLYDEDKLTPDESGKIPYNIMLGDEKKKILTPEQQSEIDSMFRKELIHRILYILPDK